MYNSTIKRTPLIKSHCKCDACKADPKNAKWPTMGCNGKNYKCLSDDEKQIIGNKIKVAQRNKNARLSAALKIRKDTNDEDKNLLTLWYKLKMNTSKKVCENCGADLSHYNEKDWHGSQHHIVDKALCPSVKSNPYNHLVLGMWCCHSQWHTSFLNASKMPIFKKAKDKFLLFKKDINPLEFKKVNPYLL